jgi:putative addiction module antidote
MTALKLRRIGNSVGLLLSKDALARLRADVGDIVHLTEAPGGLRLTPYDPEFEEQMEAMRKLARKRRNALRELAK